MSDLIVRYCPHGHKMTMSHYTWTLFLFHRCKVCRTMYNHHELTKEP